MSRGILSFAMDSTGSIDAGVFDATEQNAGNQLFCDGARYTRVAVRFVLV